MRYAHPFGYSRETRMENQVVYVHAIHETNSALKEVSEISYFRMLPAPHRHRDDKCLCSGDQRIGTVSFVQPSYPVRLLGLLAILTQFCFRRGTAFEPPQSFPFSATFRCDRWLAEIEKWIYRSRS